MSEVYFDQLRQNEAKQSPTFSKRSEVTSKSLRFDGNTKLIGLTVTLVGKNNRQSWSLALAFFANSLIDPDSFITGRGF